jgi:hypothetical protein
MCIEVAYSRYRPRSKFLFFRLSFRKAENRRRYFPAGYLLGTFLACFSGFHCIPLINIFNKIDQVEPGVGVT